MLKISQDNVNKFYLYYKHIYKCFHILQSNGGTI